MWDKREGQSLKLFTANEWVGHGTASVPMCWLSCDLWSPYYPVTEIHGCVFVGCERVNSKSIRDRTLILVSQRPSLKQQTVRLLLEVLLACQLRVSWTATEKTGLPAHVLRLACSWVVWFHRSGWPTKGMVSHWYELSLFSLIMWLPFTFDLILSLK